MLRYAVEGQTVTVGKIGDARLPGFREMCQHSASRAMTERKERLIEATFLIFTHLAKYYTTPG